VVAVDVGGTAMKGALVDAAGREWAAGTRPTPAPAAGGAAGGGAAAGGAASGGRAGGGGQGVGPAAGWQGVPDGGGGSEVGPAAGRQVVPGGGVGGGCGVGPAAGRQVVPGGGAVVEAVLDYLADLAGQAPRLTGRPARAAGVVVPGVVEEAAGVARYAANLGWRDVPLRDLAAARLGIPVVLGHDVRAGALAEALFGAARGVADVLYLPIGTGIAGALLLRGEPYLGATGRGGEIGHAPVGSPGPAAGAVERCGCVQYGCLEVYASAAAVARRYAARGGAPGLGATGLGAAEVGAAEVGAAEVGAAEVVARAAAGDPVAAAVWAEAIDALATALAGYTLVMDPALVVLGGGLAGAGQALLGPLRDALAARLAWREPPPVVAGALGSSAGRLGAAMLAWRVLGTDLTPAPAPPLPTPPAAAPHPPEPLPVEAVPSSPSGAAPSTSLPSGPALPPEPPPPEPLPPEPLPSEPLPPEPLPPEPLPRAAGAAGGTR
jgi:glucokinase